MYVENERVSYSYSIDGGRTFQLKGPANHFMFSGWKESRPALFSFNTQNGASGAVEVDWVRCHPLDDVASR